MAEKTVRSKRFGLEINAGKRRESILPSITGGLGGLPKRIKFPPNKSFITETTYVVDDKDRVRDANVKLLQEISQEEYNKLSDNQRSSSTTQGVGESGDIVTYYAIIAEKPKDDRNYVVSGSTVDILYSKENADLLKKEAAKYKNGEGQFKTVSAATNQAIIKEENLKDRDVRNGTGLSTEIPTIADEETKDILKNIEIGTPKSLRDEYEDLRYPINLNDNQDTIQFNMFKYVGLKRNDEETRFSLKSKRDFEKGKITGSVVLPIQTGIKDSNGVEWGVGNMNPLQAFGFNVLTDNNGIVNSIRKEIENLKNDKDGVTTDALNTAKIIAYQEALQVQGLLARTTGAILNPNVELLFRAPQLRGFGFSFFLAARSQPEANEIKKIIRFFKQGMSVKESTSQIFLKSPNVFQIKYLNGKKGEHEGLNKIKTCALKTFNVDYNPDGSYMTFEDGTMTAYRITMQFQELLPITETDYDGLSDTAIGY